MCVADAETDCTMATLAPGDLLAIRNRRPKVDRHLHYHSAQVGNFTTALLSPRSITTMGSTIKMMYRSFNGSMASILYDCHSHASIQVSVILFGRNHDRRSSMAARRRPGRGGEPGW